MTGSIIKNTICSIVKHSRRETKKNILRTAIYTTNLIRNTPGSFPYEVHQRMNIDNILPNVVESELINELDMSELKKTDKIKIRILYPSGTAWNCIGTVYDELCADERYQVVVITENYPAYIRVMKEKKCSFIRLENYNIKQDMPDLLLLTTYSSTREELNFKGMKQYAKHIISLFPNIVINEPDLDLHWNYVHRAYEFCEPDYYFFDSLVYNNCEGYIDEKKAVHMGNPQFDELYSRLKMANVNDPMWDKLNGKKVFLWATDHGLNEYYPIDAISLDLYIKDIISYFANNPDIGLIIRPHPYLLREMRESGVFWTESEIQKIIAFCNSTENIVWDETPDYCSAFKRCDAMMIDVNCGFTVSFLATGKPICRLLRRDVRVKLIHPELKKCYYYAKDFSGCERFINRVLSGNDPLFSKRKNAFNSSIKNFDGLNGQRIKHFIDGVFNGENGK